MIEKPKKEYHKGRIDGVVRFLAETFKFDEGYARALLHKNFPALNDPWHCANCGANMEIRVYLADMATAILLVRMATAIQEQIDNGISLEEANHIHIQKADFLNYTLQSRTTWASYLELIEQPEEWSNSGHWRITEKGKTLLSGGSIEKWVKIFRKKPLEWSDEKITLQEMFVVHADKIQEASERSKEIKNDYTADISNYPKIRWTMNAGIGQATLL